MKIEALFISDVHLGSKGSNAEQVLNILKQYQPEYLFLVGDIVDGWLLKRKFRWPQSHTNVIRKIMSYSKNGTKVIYLPGNHDEFAREYLDLNFGNIEIHNEYVWNNTYITHGDLYDGVVKLKWLGVLGSIGYDMAIYLDRGLKKLGMKRSLSKILKDRLASEDLPAEEDEVPDNEERSTGDDELQPKRADELLCNSCFLLVRKNAPMCPIGDDACPVFVK